MELRSKQHDGSIERNSITTAIRSARSSVRRPGSLALLALGLLALPLPAAAASTAPVGLDDLLEFGPPASGFPGAKGDRPLSDTVLLQTINDSPLATKELSWILKQNSPLASGVLDALQNRSPAMPRSDLDYVLRAH